MNKVKVKESKIHGLGLFADQEFNEGDMIGLAHYNGVPSEIIGKYHNHSDNPNAHSITIGNKRFLVALNPLKKGEEITVDYRQQPDLEQPEEFAKGGLVSMPKPSKKGLASKRYSRDLTATNRLLTKNKLLQKPKSKKRKIYDPNAKYYEDGGELEATVQSEVPVSDPINAISAAPTFNAAFKIARSTYGPNYIFEWQGRKYGTNLTGEEFKPSEEVLAQAGLNTSTVKENLNKQNSDLNDPYSSKSTVKLEPDTYKSWDEIKQKNLELNTSANADKIINYKNSTGGDKNYIIVDKKKGLMHVYQPGNNKPLFTSPVDLGASIGDAQTVTKIKDTNGDGIIDSKEAQVGAADFDKGNKSTGAGKYYISNIDPTGYGGLPLFNMMNESQYENFLRTGKIDNVATSIHKGFIPDDNSRVSNGCIRCNKTTLDNLTKYLENSSEVYILPEDPNNEFVIENDKLNLKVKNKSPYYTYNNNGKVYKKENGSWYVAPKIGEKFVKIDQINRIKELNKNANNAGYNFYEDSNGNVQKGQGVNLGSTLNYVPIKATLDKDKFINDKFTYFDFSDSSELEVVNKFVNSLEKNKQKVMKIAKINGDVYNDIAQIAFGIFGTESNFADTHSALGNLARATQKYFDPLGSSSPDYESKYSTYGAKENSRSVGLTQIRWNYLNADEKKALKAVGINSNSDFMDPYKAALGTTLVLGIRYNQQLTDKQKKDIWNTLPKTWNTRDNYASRVLNNSKYLKLEQKVTNKNSATKRDKWGRPSTSKWYGFNPKTKKYEYQIGGEISDRRFRKELMKEYPGMQDVYGRRGQKLRITEDPNYVASQHGNFGNIEFMFPHQDPINYTEDYSYASPHPRKYNLIYNPEGANRGDMFLDMMHGMRDDENYMKLLENFNAAVKQDRGANMDKWWAVDEAEGYPDGREQWDNNYIDGVLRAELNRLDPIAATSFDAEGYAKERELNTDSIRSAAEDIYNYLKTKHKDGGQLGNYKKGGEPKGGKPKGDEPKRKKTRFQEGTYDPNETAGYMLDEQEVVVPGQASPWGKARIAYQERHPEEEFIERKKKQYVRQSNKGLNKIFGVSTENFNPDVEQNFRDEYDYLTNTAAVKKVSRQEGWNPNKRKEYVDDLNETQRQIVANSKYGSKLQPNYWDRGLAGLATLVSPFNPGIQRMMNEGYMPGLTKRESKEILNSKMFGIPIGGLEITTPLLAQGQNLANYAKNTGLSTGSDYKEIPWFGSGESMANVSDKDVMGLDIPSLVGLGFAPEGAVNFAKGAYNLGSAGVDLAKTNPQAWFKTPEQLLQTPGLYQSLTGKTSWKDPLGKLYKFTDDVKMKKSLKRENDLLDALPGWENRQTRIPLQQEEQMKRLQLEKAAEARNLKRSKLPLKPVLTERGTHLGGGQGKIYLNTLNPEEVVKLGTLPGTPEDLSNLVKAGENLEGMPFMENVAFPTNKSFSIFHEPVNNNTTAVQFMPWQGNPLDVNNPVNIPFGSGMPSAKAKRQLQYMTEQLDKNKVGIDYFGQNNIMYDPSTDSFKLVDLNYVDDPKTAWEWNKANIPVKQRIEDKFGYIPEGDLPLELEFANAKSIKPLLGNEITDNTGKFNKGVYTFKDYPQYIAKIEDPNVVAQMQGLDKEAYLNAMMERTKNLDSGRFAKVLNTIPGKNDLRVMIMPRLRGTVGSKLSPEMLNTIPDESYADFFNQLKVLRDEGLNYDFLGDNFMYDPYTEQFNLFDLSPHSARNTEPRGGNPYFFETEVFGKGNPGIYGREQAGANLKDALRKRLNRTYMETFPGDQEVYGLDEYDQRLKAIFENLSSQKYGGANSKLFRFN